VGNRGIGLKDLIETRIIGAVRGLLAGRVNEILQEMESAVPVIEFGDYCGAGSIVPVIELASCERTEKERIIRLDAYSLTVRFSLPENPDGELYCYAYSGAFSRAIYDDPSLGGFTDRAVITGKKYIAPPMKHCGDGWSLEISLRITVEEMNK